MSTLSEKPNITTTAAIVSNSRKQRKKHSKKRPYGSRNDNTDDSDSDNVHKPGSKSKDKESSVRCYYCCKYGHKLTDCKLREQARKIRNKPKDNRKRTSSDDVTANLAVATKDDTAFSEVSVWACYTTAFTA